MKKAVKFALIQTVPVLLGYLFLGIAFGILLQKAGLGVFWAFLISALVYAGSMQFALAGILSAGQGLFTTALMTLFINSRHIFYGLTFIQRFREMRGTGPYMVFSLTDETYSLLCSAKRPEDFSDCEWKTASFFISLFDHCYWVIGSVLGALMGQLISFNTAGIDFAMTALFVVICVEQWEAAKTHLPALIGFVCGILFLALIRSSNFILPALICGAAALILFRPIIEKRMEVPRS